MVIEYFFPPNPNFVGSTSIFPPPSCPFDFAVVTAMSNSISVIICVSPFLSMAAFGEGELPSLEKELKAIDLDKAIDNFPTYNEYIKSRKKSGQSDRDIVGMTLQGAIVNLGLRHKGFLPYVVLLDEAGQIPLTEAACIGAFGAATIVFIGDEKQMPPIFHEKQTSDPLSISVFEYLCKEHPDFKQMLDVTYRMNEEITSYVSSSYYDNKLKASEYSKGRLLSLTPKSKDVRINKLLTPSPSIVMIGEIGASPPTWRR